MVHIVRHENGPWTLRDEDESTHAPGPEELWNESYYFDFALPDGSLAGYVRLGLYPNWDRAWYWACVTGVDRPLVIIADNFAPLPGPGGTDVRAASYTGTQSIASPFGPARVTVEGSAAVLPDPLAVLGDHSGAERTHFALDLEFTTIGGVYPYRDIVRYEIPCTVTGTVRVGTEKASIDAHGERDHSWGERDWWKPSWLWSSGRLDDGTAFHGMQANIPFPMEWPSFLVPEGEPVRHMKDFAAGTRFNDDGLPAASRLELKSAPMTATPVAFAPVALESPDGQLTHFMRALCRFDADDGRTGYGWTEWNQPPGWRDHDWQSQGGQA